MAQTSDRIEVATSLIHDAMDAADASYHERDTGIVDSLSSIIAAALLAAGWEPPPAIDAARGKCPLCARRVSIYPGSNGKMVQHNTTPVSRVPCLGSTLTVGQAHPGITQTEVDAIMDARWAHYRRTKH